MKTQDNSTSTLCIYRTILSGNLAVDDGFDEIASARNYVELLKQSVEDSFQHTYPDNEVVVNITLEEMVSGYMGDWVIFTHKGMPLSLIDEATLHTMLETLRSIEAEIDENCFAWLELEETDNLITI